MFKIGDEVRLENGHTRMVVIGIRYDGKVIAKYDNGTADQRHPVTLSDYHDPMSAYAVKVHGPRKFVPWDMGRVKIPHIFPRTEYKITRGAYRGHYGVPIGRLSSGMHVLELKTGESISVFGKDMSEPKADIFRARNVASEEVCFFSPPKGTTIHNEDVLLSNIGVLFVVLETEVVHQGSYIEFDGVRLVKEALS